MRRLTNRERSNFEKPYSDLTIGKAEKTAHPSIGFIRRPLDLTRACILPSRANWPQEAAEGSEQTIVPRRRPRCMFGDSGELSSQPSWLPF